MKMLASFLSLAVYILWLGASLGFICAGQWFMNTSKLFCDGNISGIPHVALYVWYSGIFGTLVSTSVLVMKCITSLGSCIASKKIGESMASFSCCFISLPCLGCFGGLLCFAWWIFGLVIMVATFPLTRTTCLENASGLIGFFLASMAVYTIAMISRCFIHCFGSVCI